MPDPTPDPWAAAVEAGRGALLALRDEHERNVRRHTDSDAGWCPICGLAFLRAALPHLLEAVVGKVESAMEWDDAERKMAPIRGCVQIQMALMSRSGLLAALQRAAARLTGVA